MDLKNTQSTWFFFKGYVLICNGGESCEKFERESNIIAYKISSEKLENLVQINNFLKSSIEHTDTVLNLYEEVIKVFGDERDDLCNALESISSEKQTVANCTSFSRGIALLGALTLQKVKINEDGARSLNSSDIIKAKQEYQMISAHVRAFPLDKYLRMKEAKKGDDCFDSSLVRRCVPLTMMHLKRAGVSVHNYPEIAKVQSAPTPWLSLNHHSTSFWKIRKSGTGNLEDSH